MLWHFMVSDKFTQLNKSAETLWDIQMDLKDRWRLASRL